MVCHSKVCIASPLLKVELFKIAEDHFIVLWYRNPVRNFAALHHFGALLDRGSLLTIDLPASVGYQNKRWVSKGYTHRLWRSQTINDRCRQSKVDMHDTLKVIAMSSSETWMFGIRTTTISKTKNVS